MVTLPPERSMRVFGLTPSLCFIDAASNEGACAHTTQAASAPSATIRIGVNLRRSAARIEFFLIQGAILPKRGFVTRFANIEILISFGHSRLSDFRPRC